MATPPEAILNTSPLLYLHRAGLLALLLRLFSSCSTTSSVLAELDIGRHRGLDVPSLDDLKFLRIRNPEHMPESWLALDLGIGETSVIALAAEEKAAVAVLDDQQARRIAANAGLKVWGTLRSVLEAKRIGAIESVAPIIESFSTSGMWISDDIRSRILRLAGE